MFDYNHHIGDFRTSTGHLTDLEELAYRRLLEVYYSTESPIPLDLDQVARKVRSTPEIIAQLMKDFFTQEPDGYHNKRCDIEIELYRQRCEKNSKAGKASARKRAEQMVNARQHEVNDRSTLVEHPLNGRQPYQLPSLPASLSTSFPKEENINPPDPKGSPPQESSRRFKQPTLEEITSYCAERKNGVDPQAFIDFYSSNGWKVGKNTMRDWKAAVRTWEARRRADAPKKDSCRSAGEPGKYDHIGRKT